MNNGIDRKPSGISERRVVSIESRAIFKALRDSITEGTCTVQNLTGALAREEISNHQYMDLITVLAQGGESTIKFLEEDKNINTKTGVYNENGLNKKLPVLIEQLNGKKRNSTPDSIMVIAADLDNFKSVNENLGHPVGNEALVAVANRLTEVIKEWGDLVFHPHGDEFRIVLSIKDNLTDEELRKVFINIEDRINTDLVVEFAEEGVTKKFSVTMAMGYAVLKRNESEKAEAGTLAMGLIKAADTSQLSAKEVAVKSARISRYNKFPIPSKEKAA